MSGDRTRTGPAPAEGPPPLDGLLPPRSRADIAREFESRIGRLLVAATYLSVALLIVGVALMALNGISPLADAPPFEPGAVVADLRSLAPTGFLWLGLIVVIATPISRVVVALFGYIRTEDRLMVVVSIAILAVIAVGVAASVAGGA